MPGDVGNVHDFLMGCIIQNTGNAYRALNNIDPLQNSFNELVSTLACDLARYAYEL